MIDVIVCNMQWTLAKVVDVSLPHRAEDYYTRRNVCNQTPHNAWTHPYAGNQTREGFVPWCRKVLFRLPNQLQNMGFSLFLFSQPELSYRCREAKIWRMLPNASIQAWSSTFAYMLGSPSPIPTKPQIVNNLHWIYNLLDVSHVALILDVA